MFDGTKEVVLKRKCDTECRLIHFVHNPMVQGLQSNRYNGATRERGTTQTEVPGIQLYIDYFLEMGESTT